MDKKRLFLLDELGLLTIGFIWGLGFVVTKIAFQNEMSATFMLAARFTIATLVLTLLFFKKFIKIRLKDVKTALPVGLAMFLGFTFQIIGSEYTTASKAAFYTALSIIFVPYILWIISKKVPSNKVLIASFIAFIGICCISYEKGQNVLALNMGDVLIIISAAFFALQIVLTGKISKKMDTTKLTLITVYLSTIGFIIMHSFVIMIYHENIVLDKTNILALIFLGAFNSGLCAFGQTYFQKYVSEVKTSLFLVTESLFAPFLAYIILGEKIGLNTIIGAFLVFVALVLLEVKIGNERKKQ